MDRTLALLAVLVLGAVLLGATAEASPQPTPICPVCGDELDERTNASVVESTVVVEVREDGTGVWHAESRVASGDAPQDIGEDELRSALPYDAENVSMAVDGDTVRVRWETDDVADPTGGVVWVDAFDSGRPTAWGYSVTVVGPEGTVVTNDPEAGSVVDAADLPVVDRRSGGQALRLGAPDEEYDAELDEFTVAFADPDRSLLGLRTKIAGIAAASETIRGNLLLLGVPSLVTFLAGLWIPIGLARRTGGPGSTGIRAGGVTSFAVGLALVGAGLAGLFDGTLLLDDAGIAPVLVGIGAIAFGAWSLAVAENRGPLVAPGLRTEMVGVATLAVLLGVVTLVASSPVAGGLLFLASVGIVGGVATGRSRSVAVWVAAPLVYLVSFFALYPPTSEYGFVGFFLLLIAPVLGTFAGVATALVHVTADGLADDDRGDRSSPS